MAFLKISGGQNITVRNNKAINCGDFIEAHQVSGLDVDNNYNYNCNFNANERSLLESIGIPQKVLQQLEKNDVYEFLKIVTQSTSTGSLINNLESKTGFWTKIQHALSIQKLAESAWKFKDTIIEIFKNVMPA